MKAVKWYDVQARVWYAGVEDKDGALIDLGTFPGYGYLLGYTGIDSPTRRDAEEDRESLKLAIWELSKKD